MKFTFISILTILCTHLSLSQNLFTIKGWVHDADKQPLQGVTVQLAGTSRGVATDANGFFSLKVVQPKGELIFSYIGMQTIKKPYQGDTDLSVTLHEDTVTLEGVQVVAKQNINEIDG